MDRYGGKVLLLVSFTASAAWYAVTASATTHLYVSGVRTLLQHAVLGAQVIISMAPSVKPCRYAWLRQTGI